MNTIRRRAPYSSQDSRAWRRHVKTVLALVLAGSASVALGQEGPDPRAADIFSRFCIETFPSFVPSSSLIAEYEASGDDPAAPPRSNATGTNRTWSIPPFEGKAYNLVLQTYFGEVNGEAASGCSLITSGQLDAPLIDQLQGLFPEVATLAAPEPAGSGITRRRSLVEIAGKATVWSIVERDDPPHNGFDITLERLPQSHIDGLGLTRPR